MIRASSLFYALMVSLLLGALLSAVIMNAHLRSMLTERWLAYNVARDDAHGALEIPVPGPLALIAITDSVDLFGDGDHYVSVSQAAWGLFDIRTCSALEGDQRVSRSALLGWRCDPQAPSLWVMDRNEPIALAGETRIDGMCFLPKRGLRRAYIEGRPYSGSLTLQDQRVSPGSMPQLPERIMEHIRLFTDGVLALGEEPVRWSAVPRDSLVVAYSDPPLVIDMGSERELRNTRVSGHVLFIARDSVVVEASFHCSGIVICAPHVTIATGFSGDLQCFTRRGAIVEPGAELLYPSVLVCTGDEAAQGATVSVAEGSSLDGVIIGWTMEDKGSVTVEFAAGTTFIGELWNDGPVQLHGVMEGTVIAESVVLRTPSSVYRGHIMDVQLGPLRRTEHVGVGLWGDAADIAVLRWLDTSS